LRFHWQWRWRGRGNGRRGGQKPLRRLRLGRRPDLRRRGRCRCGLGSGRRLRSRCGRLRRCPRCASGAGAARPASRLEPRNQLTSSGRTEVGAPICPPQRLTATRCLCVAPVSHLAGRTLCGVGAAQLDPAHQIAVPAPVLGRSCRVPGASCTESKRQERSCPQTPRHQIGTSLSEIEFSRARRQGKIA
jgi:hypothetical protein